VHDSGKIAVNMCRFFPLLMIGQATSRPGKRFIELEEEEEEEEEHGRRDEVRNSQRGRRSHKNGHADASVPHSVALWLLMVSLT
jgi:hypothetical protein